MVSPSRRGLVSELATEDRLLEIGIGRRPEVARALAERGCDVVGIDVDVDARAREAAERVHRAAAEGDVEGSLRIGRGDIISLAQGVATSDGEDETIDREGEQSDGEGEQSDGEGEQSDREGETVLGGEARGFDAVYACNLPAELQRPTVALADRFDAACLFTTLGFEEPVVPVRRRSVAGTTLYVARDADDDGPNGGR